MEDRRPFSSETTPATIPRCEKCGGETKPSTFRVSTPGVKAKPVLICKVCGFRYVAEVPGEDAT
jgi:hypothetical protein